MRKHRGFTMTEILIVIGIIGAVLALLLPVISMSRQNAHVVKCLSKQKSFMQAIQAYAADNDGMLPAPNWGGGLRGWLYDPTKTGPGFKESDVETGVLYPYLKTHDAYRCSFDLTSYSPSTVQVMTSFVMNGAVCNYDGNSPPGSPCALHRLKGNAILIWEIAGNSRPSGQVNDGADWPAEGPPEWQGPATRHKHGTTVGFLDGHADLMTWEQFTDEWYNRAPGGLWCAPQFPDGGRQRYISSRGWPASPPTRPPYDQ